MKVHIIKSELTGRVEILLYRETGPLGSQGFQFVKPIDLEWIDWKQDQSTEVRPTIVIDDYHNEFLENLADQLNSKGIRPKETSRVEGILEATKFHLEDMRKLVFEK